MKRYIKCSTYYNLIETLLSKYQYPNYTGLPSNIRFHNTRFENISSIMNTGLKVDNTRNNDGSIWCTDIPYKDGYGSCTVAFETVEEEHVNADEYIIHEDVPPNNILFIDAPIVLSSSGNCLYKLSDIPRLINKFGELRTIKVLDSKKYEVLYPISNVISYIKVS